MAALFCSQLLFPDSSRFHVCSSHIRMKYDAAATAAAAAASAASLWSICLWKQGTALVAGSCLFWA